MKSIHVRSVLGVARKEIRSVLFSPILYVVAVLFLLLNAYFFGWQFFTRGQADLRSFFTLLPIFFAVVVPLITMRLFSEEFATGSWELLATLPLTTTDIVAGKFLSSVVFIALLLVPTIAYPIWIELGPGELDMGVVVGSYLGALLLGATYAAIGCLASALTRNQIIAALVAIVVCVALWGINQLLVLVPNSLASFLQQLSTDFHFTSVARGVVDLRDILYFASVIFLSLFATRLAVEEKRA